MEGLGRLAALPRRPDRRRRDRAVRGAGIRLRREAAHGRGRARRLARPRARRAARPRGGRASAALRRGVLGRRARRLLRARARRREAPVDSLTSNIGHLLWSPGSSRRSASTSSSTGSWETALWSGWGVRTMSTDDAGFNPLSYHNGTVWPHDNSLDRVGSRAAGPLAGVPADRPPHAGRSRAFRLAAARGVRGARPGRDAVPDRLSDCRAGRRPGRPARRCCSSSCCSGSCRTATGSGSSRSRPTTCRRGSASPRLGHPGVRPPLGRDRRRRPVRVEAA